ncbi:hypothetical protein ACTFIZ_009461 [Dictyostelium cf. discoideum]
MELTKILLFFTIIKTIILSINALSIDRFEQVNNSITVYGSGFGNDGEALAIMINSSYYSRSDLRFDVVDTQVSFDMLGNWVYNGMLKATLNINEVFEYGNIEIIPILNSFMVPNNNLGTSFPSYASIGGYHFDASLVGAEILMDGKVITNCNVTATANYYPTAYKCEIPPGVGGFNLTVKVASKTSNQMTIWYNAPSVSSVEPVFSFSSSPLSIFGNDFQHGAVDKTVVTFDGVEAEVISSTESLILVKHDNTLKPIDPRGFLTTVTVGGQIASFRNGAYLTYKQYTNYGSGMEENGTYRIDLLFPNWNHTDFVLNNISVKSYCQPTPFPTVENEPDLIIRLICDFPPSIKSGGAYFTDTINRLDFNILFPPYVSIPSTQQINDIPLEGGEITFIGKHFDTTMFDGSPNNLVINYNGNNYTNYNLINNTYMTFNIPAGSGTNNYLFISSNIDTTQQPFIVSYSLPEIVIYSIIQKDQGLIIKGSNFNDIALMTITLSTIDISSTCVGNSTDITCGPILPAGVKSGELLIESPGYKSASSIFYLTPVVTSINPKSFDTQTSNTLTITGVYFESVDPISQKTNNLQVFVDNTVLLSVLVDLKTILITISPGVGSGHEVKVSLNQTRVSNIETFTYFPPTISNRVQSDNQFEVSGDYFGTNSQDNKVYYNNILIDSKLSSTGNIQFTLLDNFSNGELYIQVGNQKSNIVLTVLTPIITSISKKPYVDGSSVITVSGRYFSNLNYQTQQPTPMTFEFSLDNDPSISNVLSCNYINSISYSCKFTTFGFGNANLVATKTDESTSLKSNTFSISYQEPKVIQSTSLFYQVPGLINITVESYSPNSLQVFVSNSECTNPIVLLNKQIQCNYNADVPPNTDGKSLNITVISNQMVGINEVFYYNSRYECPNSCSNHGLCNFVNGQCQCSNGWQSNDCSQEKQQPLPEPTTDDNGKTTLNGNDNINFTVSITYLREIDINDKTVKLLSLKDIQWNNRTQISKTDSYFNGTFENDSVQVELDVTFYKDEENIDFAGDTVLIPSNSMKYIIVISNWNFTSSTNNLQVIYNSQTTAYYDDGCDIIQSNSSSNVNEGSKVSESVTWFQVVSGNSAMDAKFSRRMFVDEKVRMASVSILDSTDQLYTLTNRSDTFNKLIAITTPYFKSNVKLDPSFSSLIQPSTSTSECEENKWKIPVIAVLCSVGGATIIGVSAAMIYKSYKNKKIVLKLSTKLRNIK